MKGRDAGVVTFPWVRWRIERAVVGGRNKKILKMPAEGEGKNWENSWNKGVKTTSRRQGSQ